MADEPWPSVKRVLITADAVGGVWQYTATLAQILVAGGVQVMVATMGPTPSETQRAELPPEVDLVTSRFALEWAEAPWHDVDAAGQWLLHLAHQFRPDLIHLNGYSHAALPWDIPVVVVAHSCVLSWCFAVRGTEAPAIFDEYRRRVRAGLQNADSIVAPSKFMAGELNRWYGIPCDAINVVYNCCADNLITSREPKEMFCLAAGRFLDDGKNVASLQQAGASTNVPIYLAGDERHGLGRLSHAELMRWMRRASVFAHPAVYEPFGLVVLEAARANCCLLLADTTSARELWDGAAIFLDPHSPARWAEFLQHLSGDQDLCRHWGALAFQRSMRYRESGFARGYSDLYCRMLSRYRIPA